MKNNFGKIIGWLSKFEGVIHLAVSLIGLWGCIATGIWDIRLVIPVIENFVFGFVALVAGYYIHAQQRQLGKETDSNN